MPGVHLKKLAALDIDIETLAEELLTDVLFERQTTFEALVHLQKTCQSVAADGYTQVLVIGMGVDLSRLLAQTAVRAENASGCNCPVRGDNAAAQLGTALGVLAQNGRDKVTFVLSPALAGFGEWVEHLLAVSTGKEGKGLAPIVGEPLSTANLYGNDRVFVYVRLENDTTYDRQVAGLAAAGLPVLTMHLHDIYDVGGLCFTWQMATAVVAHQLAINPFDHRAIDTAKQKASQAGSEFTQSAELPEMSYAPLTADALAGFLAQAETGDYVALLAFLPKTVENDLAIQKLREQIFRHTHLATTVAYGPRYLHSTAQLHKEGTGHGLFVQLIGSDKNAKKSVDVLIPMLSENDPEYSTFGVLTFVQAAKDAQVLKAARQRVIAFPVSLKAASDLQRIAV